MRGKGEGGRGKRTAPLSLFLFLVAFSLLGSLFSRLTRLDPGPIAPITSLLTLGVGVWATFGEYVRRVPRAGARLLATLALGATAEIVGLATGLPFGSYTYTRAWWPTVVLPIGPFPLALPFAWLLMAGSAVLCFPRSAFAPLLGGLLGATVDLAMEPVMAGPLGYWRWRVPGPLPGGAPILNFAGWWAVGALGGALLVARAPSSNTIPPRWVLGGFTVLIVGLGLIRR